MMINFKKLVFLFCTSSFVWVNSFPICQAQSNPSPDSNTTEEVIRVTSPDGKIKEFPIQNTSRKNDAERVAKTLIQTGVSLDAIAIAINFVEVGADPESVTNLMLTLNGLAADKNQVSVAQLNRAINAYNIIVNKSDLSTLQALKNMTAFMDIRSLLQGI
jgi:hypothetical protein